MPRVKPLGKPDPRKLDMVKKIAGLIAVSGMSLPEIAKTLGIPYSTLYAHIKRDVGNLRLRELWMLEDLVERGQR